MKGAEIRAMTPDELKKRLDDAYQELFNLRFQKATRQLKDTSRIRVVKRDIARLKTVLRERELWQLWEAEQA
jgi:large subunit ribosomal protein L29